MKLVEELGSPASNKHTDLDWLPNANNLRHTLTGHSMPITAVAFHPILASFASSSEDCTVKIWDWERGVLEKTLRSHTKLVTDCSYDSRGKNLGKSSSKTQGCMKK